MRYFLAKTEPQTYSIDDLRRDGETVWDGIKNPQALKALGLMEPGDRVFIYHSGGVSAIVGLAEVIAGNHSSPPATPSATLRYRHHLHPPTSLAQVKQSKLFDDWALVRQSRLSTMEAPGKFATWLQSRYPSIQF